MLPHSSSQASTSQDAALLLVNGKFFNTTRQDDETPFFDWMYIYAGAIKNIGRSADTELDSLKTRLRSDPSQIRDLNGKTVLPGFLDGHMHLLMLGQSLQKLDLWGCDDLNDIRTRIQRYAEQHREVERIMCKSWMNSMSDGKALASMLDHIPGIKGRPIFIDAKDLHGVWCNSAALDEMHVASMEVPPGGLIERDAYGKSSGLIGETCVFTHVWPHLARVSSMYERVGALKAAIRTYTEAGYTGVVDMAMDDHAWEAIHALLSEEPTTPIRISAYWFIAPTNNVQDAYKQIDKAIEMSRKFSSETSPNARILGIKLMLDGVIDACRAAVNEPYSTNGELPDVLWKAEIVNAVVKYADEAGLQCAIHAIGDAAITMAIDAI